MSEWEIIRRQAKESINRNADELIRTSKYYPAHESQTKPPSP